MDEKLIRLVSSSRGVNCIEDYKAWVAGDVRAFFPFGMMIFALGRQVGGRIIVDAMAGVDYPDEFILRIAKTCDLSDRRVITRWIDTMAPQLIDADNAPSCLSGLELREFAEFGLRNIAAYGFIDIGGLWGSYFSFSRIPGRLTAEHAASLELLVPYLHQTLLRLYRRRPRAFVTASHPADLLSPKERAVLGLVIQGRTNKEIAKQLARSELTIQNHVHKLLDKLNARNRAQAIVRAMELGLANPAE